MKRAVLLTIFLLLCIHSIGQVPESFNYQAIPRNSSGGTYPDQAMTVKISILSGSPTGGSVYCETFAQTTTSLGMLNLQIGKGNYVSGSFTTINWGSNSYYLKVEIDPSGGTTYVDMGTIQLLSVPYALYSKKAQTADYNNLSNLPNLSVYLTSEADPVFGVWNKSTGINITASQISDFQSNVTNNSSVLANTAKNSYPAVDATKLAGIASGAEVNVNADWNATGGDALILNKPTAGNGININGSNQIVNTAPDQIVSLTGLNGITITGSYPGFIISGTTTHAIGENYGGGKVFYVTPDGQHGLIAETQDQATACIWLNAQDMVSNPANHSTAGKSFTDWRLPTKYELNQLYLQRSVVGGFVNLDYWSSTQVSTVETWVSGFYDGGQYQGAISNTFHVRAVRAF